MQFEGSMGVSVLICTFNGGRNLPETLSHLSRQRVSSELEWEILLIDNASTDDTAQMAVQTWINLKSLIPFKVLPEPRPGKNNAIDTGLLKARYKYAIICDDDNWLEENYVQTAFETISGNARIGMLGGRGIPVFEGKKPVWFDQFENYYAVGRQNLISGEVTTSKGFLWGAGAVINREAYFKLLRAGFSRIITYQKYPEIARGEDIELCMAIRLAGYKIWFDEQLIFWHYISKPKLTWSYLTRLAKEGASMGLILNPYRRLLNNSSPAVSTQPGWARLLLRHLYSGINYKKWTIALSASSREGQAEVLKLLNQWQYLKTLLIFNKKLDENAAGVALLAKKLRTQL
jgi:glycosyltransferase involved in cell wall biosynthesis